MCRPPLKTAPKCTDKLIVAKVKSWTEEETRRRRLDYVRARPRWVLFSGAIFMGLGVLALVLIMITGPSWLAWTCFGAFLGGGSVFILRLIDDASGARNTIVGGDAQLSTRDELLKIPHAIVVSGPRFDKVDVDHVLICADGVYAVETKFTSRPINTGSRFADRQLRGFIGDARNRCRKLQNFLSSSGLEVRVEPMLVVWGYRVADLPGGAMMAGGTLVVVGRQSKQWRTLFQRPRISADLAQKIQRVVDDSQRSSVAA